MSCVVRNRLGMLRYNAAHYITDQIHVSGYCEQQMADDCERSGITAEEFAQSKIILSFLHEGFTPTDIAPLTDILSRTHSNRYMVLFNANIDVEQLSYPARCVTTWLINGQVGDGLDQSNYNFDIQLDRKFLCLIRRPTLNRARLARFLLDHIGKDTVRLSFGSGITDGLDRYKAVVGCDLPLLVDGLLKDPAQKFDVANPVFHSCLFNIVAETSSQSEENWRSIFLTEKTWKAIMQRQIPVWFGVPGLVEHVRSLGFDTFDDILAGHQYDTIQDEAQRHQSFGNLISQLNGQYSLADCQALRQKLQPRLETNFDQLLEYFRTNRQKVSNAIREFDYQTGLTALSK